MNFRRRPTDQWSGEDTRALVHSTNSLLVAAGIGGRKIRSTQELQRVSGSIFVAIYESLFSRRLEGAIRNPKLRSDYEFNVQLVIDAVADEIGYGDLNISATAIVDGDLSSLSMMVRIILRICAITGQDSVSRASTSEGVNVSQGIRLDGSNFESISSDRVGAANSTSEQSVLRGVFSGLLRTMCSWDRQASVDDDARISRIKSEARETISNLRSLFEQRSSLLRQHSSQANEMGRSHDLEQRQIRTTFSHAYSDRQRRMQATNEVMHREERNNEVRRRRESNKVFKALLNAEVSGFY